MKYNSLFFLLMVLAFCTPVIVKAQTYTQNKAPLKPVPFLRLPYGAVEATGWLRQQLELQKNGLTGNAELLYKELGSNSAWLGGNENKSDWERPVYYVKGLLGLAYTLKDEMLISKTQKWIEWTLKSQQENGQFGPGSNDDWWPRMVVLYYLRDYYEITGDQRVIPFLLNYFRYQLQKIDGQPLLYWAKARTGDNIDVIFWLYNRTGASWLLDLSEKLKQQSFQWTSIFNRNLFIEKEGDSHNVNVAQARKFSPVWFQYTWSDTDRVAYANAEYHLQYEHGRIDGMYSGTEPLSGRLSRQGIELCGVVEQMLSDEIAISILGDAIIGDHLEKITFNALPACLSPDITQLQYYQTPNQAISNNGSRNFYKDNYRNGIMPGPHSGYPCCNFNFHMGWPYFVKHMWMATADGGLAAIAYGPNNVTAYVGDSQKVHIKSQTNYPFHDEIEMTVTLTGDPVIFPMQFRIPEWCKSPVVEINGKRMSDIKSGSFYIVNREWKNGDRINLKFPMEVVVSRWVNNTAGVERGPLVYSLKFEEEWKKFKDYSAPFHEYEVYPASKWNYALDIDFSKNINSQFVFSYKPSDQNPFNPLTSPVTISVKAKPVKSWSTFYTDKGRDTAAIMPEEPPASPLQIDNSIKRETISLIPYGAGHLRLAYMPVMSKGFLLEAESCHQISKAVIKDTVTVSGGKYLLFTEANSGAVSSTVVVPEDGHYDVAVHYASNQNSKVTGNIIVLLQIANEEYLFHTLPGKMKGNFRSIRKKIFLKKGTHKISLLNKGVSFAVDFISADKTNNP